VKGQGRRQNFPAKAYRSMICRQRLSSLIFSIWLHLLRCRCVAATVCEQRLQTNSTTR